MKIIAIIPSRYGSFRFPGKPLADIGGMTMIERVYNRAAEVFGNLYVATDDIRIFDEVKRFGGNPLMTSDNHANGSSRIIEGLNMVEKEYSEKYDIVVNIQGDEPFIQPDQLRELLSGFEDPSANIVTLVKRFEKGEDIMNPDSPKVVFDSDMRALYFSRSPIPYVRGCDSRYWTESACFYKHIGLYAFKRDSLLKISNLKPAKLELAENLEQLRWLESGLVIKVRETAFQSYAIDSPNDILKLKSLGLV